MAESRDYYFFGTTKGLDVFDKHTLKTRKLPFAAVNNVEIRSIVVDKNGGIWVGTYRRLLKLSPDLSKCEDMTASGRTPKTSVNQIYLDRQGNIWVMFWEHGLYRYDTSGKCFRAAPRIGKRNNPFHILQMGDGSYVVSTWGDGLFRMDSKGLITPIAVTGDNKDALSTIFDIVYDNLRGITWLIDDDNIYATRLSGNKISILNRQDMDVFKNKQFNSIFADRDGNLWIGTKDDSFFRIYADRRAFTHFTIDGNLTIGRQRPQINSIFNAANGDLWYSTDGVGIGVICADGKHFSLNIPNKYSYMAPLGYIRFICQPSFLPQNHIWMLPKYRKDIYELKCEKTGISVVKSIDTGNTGLPLALFEDSKGNLWFSTNIGVSVRRKGGSRFTMVKSLAYDDICSITEDNLGHVWMASQSHGLIMIETANNGKNIIKTKKEYNSSNSKLPTSHVESIVFDRHNNQLWIGLAEGFIISHSAKNGQFKNHSHIVEGGIRGDVIGMQTDPHGNLWIATAMGIVRFDPSRRSIIAYNSADIDVNNFCKNACIYRPNGDMMVFGGRGGIVGIHSSESDTNDKSTTMPIISDMKVGGISIYDGLGDNTYSLDNKQRLVRLGCDARNVEIDFSACEYGLRRHLFAYMIEGIDRTWNYCGEGRASAYYSVLPKGTHRLLIRYTDDNGQWSDNIISYKLYKQPHLWETWWAYTLYLLAALAVAYYIYNNARQRMHERQRRQIDRIERQKEEELVQTKLRYFTNVSHDFLTPITVISCIIDDMRMTSHAYDSQFTHIRANLNRLRQLIQQVLDFRKMENGKMKLAVSEGDLGLFVGNICHNYFEPLTSKKPVQLIVNIPTDRTVHGLFDANKIEKIIIDLLSNAFKYTEHGEISVSLCEAINDGRRLAVLKVADTGSGIAQKDIAHIFDRFYTTRASRSDSNGVGLSLVKEIAELHHATISVDSELGNGSTFTLAIPLDADGYLPGEIADKNEAADRLELCDPATTLPGEEPQPTADERRMLIVEDNEELLTLMQRIFSRYHTVLTATNGSEGLDMARTEHPDIIVSDVMMPVMDGLEMCRQLKADAETSHIPVILLTARATTEDRVECYEAGADGYIAKPFELSVLKARIENFLRQRHERQKEYRADDHASTTQLQMSTLDKKFMDKTIKEIESHIDDEDYDIGQLAEAVCMSKSTLYRKIKSLTDMSPVEFLRTMRLKKSHRMLTENPDLSISEIASSCGFSTLRYFSKCFKEEYGMAPSELRKQ